MRTTFRPYFYIVIIGVLVLSSCNLPTKNGTAKPTQGSQTEPPPVTITLTSASTATLTQIAATETPTATATETLPAEPSATDTPQPIMAKVNRVTNCRTGPAGNYDLVAQYPAGQMLQIVAKDLGNTYWVVQNPEKPDEQCYLLAQNVTISGDTSALPKFTPQPSPTAAPDFKVSFKKFDVCNGDTFALFILENTGSVPFSSVYGRVTDLKVNKSVDQSFNAFDLYVGCVLAKNIAPLNPGGTGYFQSGTFTWEARSHKLRATIMACTEKNLKGVCVTKNVDIAP